MLRHGVSFTKRLIRLRSVLIRCEDDGLCGYSAAAEGIRRSLGIKITGEEIFFKYHKKAATYPVSQHEWADDSFFVLVTEEFGVQLKFYLDVEDGSSALELFCYCGRDGNISVLDKHRPRWMEKRELGKLRAFPRNRYSWYLD